MKMPKDTGKDMMRTVHNKLEGMYLTGKLNPLELATYGIFLANMNHFKLMDKTHLDAMVFNYEIQDLEMVKNEVEIQTEMFAREFQKSVKNMFRKVE